MESTLVMEQNSCLMQSLLMGLAQKGVVLEFDRP